MLAPDIILVDRDPHHRKIAHLLGMADTRAQPGEIQELHEPNTSEKGRKSMVAPGARSVTSSPITAKPSDCTIEDRMPAPSLGYLSAMSRPPSRCKVARTYSRRPAFLR